MNKALPLNDLTNAHKPSTTRAPGVLEKDDWKLLQQRLELAEQTAKTYDLPRILTACT